MLHRAGAVVDRRAAQLEPARAGVGGSQRQVEGERQPALYRLPPLLRQRRAFRLGHRREPAVAARGLLVEPGEIAPVAVAERQRAVRVALPDHLRAEVDQRAVTLLGGAGGGLLGLQRGEVAHDLDETVRLRSLPQYGERAAAPEAAAVASPIPALMHGRALRQRTPQRLAGFVLAVLVGKQFAEAMAEHLFGIPVEDAMGALVPAGDAALQVQRDDRVVDYAVDDVAVAQQLQLRHRLTAQRLQAPPCGRI
ncbi:hypothetical protein D3C77_519840 [compost metagenome]